MTYIEPMTNPVAQNGKYLLQFGHTTVEVDPNIGARITSLRVEGSEVLTGPDVDPVNFGSTFWTSPQLDWNVSPAVLAHDVAPYRAKVSGSTLILEGERGRQGKVDASVVKRLRAEPEREALQIEYVIRNHASEAVSYAPWEVTRVFPSGLSFYRTQNPPVEHGGNAPLVTFDAAGHTWFPYDASKIVALHNKLYADSSEGFLAHVTTSRILFVKTFPVIAPSEQAPDQGMIEIYATGKHTYIELEAQGPYTSLAPDQSLGWSVRWFARKLPSNVEVAIGSESLLAFVYDLIRA